MNVGRIGWRAAGIFRSQRAAVFRQYFDPRSLAMVLDLGGYDGGFLADLGFSGRNCIVADVDATPLAKAAARGFGTLVLDATGTLPFRTAAFDLVICNSVIEHLTGPHHEVKWIRSRSEFLMRAWRLQRQAAAEIRRVGKSYFVQSPHRWFPVESHSWLPMPYLLLPRSWQVTFIEHLINPWWVKSTGLDFHLLDSRTVKQLFPDSEVIVERTLGLPRSVIAIRKR